MGDKRPTRPAFSDISNIIRRGLLAAMVPGQFLRIFFCETVTRIIYVKVNLQMMKREKRGRKGIENNVNTTHGKGPRKPKNKEKSGIESNVNTVQGKKTPAILTTPDHGILNLIMYTILLCLCIEMSNTLNFYTPRTM